MPPLKRRDLVDILIRKFGFEWDEPSDHPRMALWIDDHKWVTVKIPNPHSKQDVIGDGILRQIASRCRVDLSYFKAMAGCTRDRDEYYAKLRSTFERE